METGDPGSGVQGDQKRLKCPECDGWMVLRPSRFGQFYGCQNFPECSATHGAHEDGRPLGVPGDADTRQARQDAHAAFDPLWQDALRMYDDDGDRPEEFLTMVARSRAYSWLATTLGMQPKECHIGAFDRFHCTVVIHACKGVTPEKIRAWAKGRSHTRKIAKVVKKYGSEQMAILERDDDGNEQTSGS